MQYEPGERWKYTQSGINAGARIVEVVSGMTFDAFVQKRIFDPLGMKDTTFYPTDGQRPRLATAYAKNKETGALEPVPPRADFGPRDRPPQGNGGLYSTAPDYARFCQMLLNGGTFEGRRYLSAAAMALLTTPQTGDLPTGFFQTDTYGNRGANYGWGITTSILRTPHDGVGRDALARHLRTRRRLGHAGLDRSGEGRRLHPDGAALELPEQRCQRRAPRVPGGGGQESVQELSGRSLVARLRTVTVLLRNPSPDDYRLRLRIPGFDWLIKRHAACGVISRADVVDAPGTDHRGEPPSPR